MNNVDIAMEKVRELQSLIYDNNASPNKLFEKTTEIMKYMEKASKEIKTNYEEISERLTKEMNTGVKQ